MIDRTAWPVPNRFAMRAMALGCGVALLTGTAAAAAGDMTVAIFLAKADALKAKGPLALLSSDIKLLQGEGQAAGAAYHAQLDAERKAGHPSSCPPKGVKIGGDELMAQMRKYPVATRQRITVKAAMVDMLRAKFPCPS